MQNLQWFPGHMAVATRMIEENVKLIDAVLVVLDARCPYASLNEKIIKMFSGKRILYLLNKSDLIFEEDRFEVIKNFRDNNRDCVAVSSLNKKSVDGLYGSIVRMLKDFTDKNLSKGIHKTPRLMVIGVPNTGKSSLINALSGAKKTVTGNKAGVTRNKQWIRGKDFELLDTPGIMPPAFDNQIHARHLAYVGSMNDDNLDFTELAICFIEEMCGKYSGSFISKYKIETTDGDAMGIFEEICKRRGFIKRGNEYDYERCGIAIIDDFRKGRLGKIFLEGIKNV